MASDPEGSGSVQPVPAPVIIVRKKKVGHNGHHGGAWKVAYADFVTAMMALFIVLWLMSADKEVQDAVSAYFKNPSGPGKMSGTAAAGLGNAIRSRRGQREAEGKNPTGVDDHAELPQPEGPRQNQDHPPTALESNCWRRRPACSSIGSAGSDRNRRCPSNTPGRGVGQLPNTMLIEGHTDSKPFAGDGSYTNWELSADRANSARKLMQAHGLRPEQIGQVRGFADRQLRHPEEPAGASNRRISVIVQYLPAAPGAPQPPGKAVPPAANPLTNSGSPASVRKFGRGSLHSRKHFRDAVPRTRLLACYIEGREKYAPPFTPSALRPIPGAHCPRACLGCFAAALFRDSERRHAAGFPAARSGFIVTLPQPRAPKLINARRLRPEFF